MFIRPKKHIVSSGPEPPELGGVDLRALADGVCRYDLNDMDAAWLELTNEEFKEMGEAPSRAHSSRRTPDRRTLDAPRVLAPSWLVRPRAAGCSGVSRPAGCGGRGEMDLGAALVFVPERGRSCPGTPEGPGSSLPQPSSIHSIHSFFRMACCCSAPSPPQPTPSADTALRPPQGPPVQVLLQRGVPSCPHGAVCPLGVPPSGHAACQHLFREPLLGAEVGASAPCWLRLPGPRPGSTQGSPLHTSGG